MNIFEYYPICGKCAWSRIIITPPMKDSSYFRYELDCELVGNKQCILNSVSDEEFKEQLIRSDMIEPYVYNVNGNGSCCCECKDCYGQGCEHSR